MAQDLLVSILNLGSGSDVVHAKESVINKRQIDYIKKVCKHEDPGTITLEKFINDATRMRTVNRDDLFRQYVMKKSCHQKNNQKRGTF